MFYAFQQSTSILGHGNRLVDMLPLMIKATILMGKYDAVLRTCQPQQFSACSGVDAKR